MIEDKSIEAMKKIYLISDDTTEDWMEQIGIDDTEKDEQQLNILCKKAFHNWSTLRRLLGIDITQKKSCDQITEAALVRIQEASDDKDMDLILSEIFSITNEEKKLDELFIEVKQDLHVFKSTSLTPLIHYFDLLNSSEEIEEEELEESEQEIKGQFRQSTIGDMIMKVLTGQLILNPPWQRGNVWSPKEKRNLIKSVMRGIPLPGMLIYSKGGQSWMLDGKQRMTALWEYHVEASLKPPNNWSTKIPVKGGEFKLNVCNNKPYEDLHDKIKGIFLRTPITYIEIPDINNKQTVELFELYNSTGKPLKPVEIRNAIYHSTEMHRMLFEITGEGDFQSSVWLKGEKLNNTIKKLRDFKNGIRFDTLELAEKYLGYSRCWESGEGGAFKSITAKEAIYRFWEYKSLEEDPKLIAEEFDDSLRMAYALFDDTARGWKKSNNGIYIKSNNSARFLTTMMIANFATQIYNKTDEEKQSEVFKTMKEIIFIFDSQENQAMNKFGLPDAQNGPTLWDYQARWITGFIKEIKSRELGRIEDLDDYFQKFHSNMLNALL